MFTKKVSTLSDTTALAAATTPLACNLNNLPPSFAG